MDAGIAVAVENADRLGLVLQEEFQALSTEDIDSFEKLQPVKAQLLALLTAFVQTIQQPDPPTQPQQLNVESVSSAHPPLLLNTNLLV